MLTKSTRIVSDNEWRALWFFNLYRIILASLFATLAFTETLPPPLAVHDEAWFIWSSYGFFAASLIAQYVIETRLARFTLLVVGQLLIDVVAISALMYASGGIDSGFGILLVVSIIGGSLLSAARLSFFFAAIASLSVLLGEFYFWYYGYFSAANYTRAGLLGASFFAAALVGHFISRRLQESEALAQQRGQDLQSLGHLNEHIVRRMQSGIVVLDEYRQVRLINESAQVLLGLNRPVYGLPLLSISKELSHQLQQWQQHVVPGDNLIPSDLGEGEIWVSFAELEEDEGAGNVLIYLEDAARMRQRAQQLKLASLGRLTASIAHEIRNPLGAISHAGQLLAESPQLDEQDMRLTGIIRDHCQRVNNIIENVMQISRRENSIPEVFPLIPWLDTFREELIGRFDLSENDVLLLSEEKHLEVRMDPSQLHQVLWNLCENGLRYSKESPLLVIKSGIREDSHRPFIEIIDSGNGMPESEAEHVFEPFFTTECQGTGLGLYLVKELCEGNQASISLQSSGEEGCCFRILFAHPERSHEVNL